MDYKKWGIRFHRCDTKNPQHKERLIHILSVGFKDSFWYIKEEYIESLSDNRSIYFIFLDDDVIGTCEMFDSNTARFFCILPEYRNNDNGIAAIQALVEYKEINEEDYTINGYPVRKEHLHNYSPEKEKSIFEKISSKFQMGPVKLD